VVVGVSMQVVFCLLLVLLPPALLATGDAFHGEMGRFLFRENAQIAWYNEHNRGKRLRERGRLVAVPIWLAGVGEGFCMRLMREAVVPLLPPLLQQRGTTDVTTDPGEIYLTKCVSNAATCVRFLSLSLYVETV
jgi:hypothetical protein